MMQPGARTLAGPCGLFVMLCTLLGYGFPNPCEDDMSLHNDGLRYLHNEGNGSYELFEDRFLKTGWYRSCEPMLTTDPKGIFKCGTQFPIWLNGTHPDSTTLVDMTACLRTVWESCKRQLPVSIIKCEDNCFRYYLEATQENSGYCFGVGVQGKTPSFVPETPRVDSRLQRTDVPEVNSFVTETLFVCDFVESSDGDLLYMVHWYKNGIAHYNTPLAGDSNDSKLHITEDVFVAEKFEMGMDLSCSVTAFFIAQGPAGIRSEQSEKVFVGIKVLTPDISIDTSTSTSATIQVQPTVQMGCQGLLNCKLGLTTHVPSTVKGECQPMGFDSRCGVYIYSNNYNNIYSMNVVAIYNGQVKPEKEEHHEIFLKTSDTQNNNIWGNYLVEPISVTITHGSGSVSSEQCSIVNDPHIKTFDGRKYDDHLDRFYDIGDAGILYWNTFYNTEVQVLYRTCYTGATVRCLSGVAARAGQDVYVYQVDPDAKKAYVFCSDSGRSLTVEKINDQEIKINFHHGTYVKIKEQFIYGSTFLTAEIYPSGSDENNTRGLCGTLDGDTGNDFHYRDGTSFGSSYHTAFPSEHIPTKQPLSFIKEWSVPPAENLFNASFDTSLLQPYVTSVCICEKTQQDSGQGGLNDTIPCTSNGVTSCTQGKVLEANHCSFIAVARRRRAEQTQTLIPTVDISNRFETNKRTKRQTLNVTWTETLATEICRKSFESSDVYQACSQVPSVSSDNSLSVCIADIQITGGTDWVGLALLDYASECKEEVTFRNLTIVKQRAAGETMYDQIDNVTCPSDCSGRGQCVKGECICDEGAGLSDCSIDLTLPPTLSGLWNGGLCDKITEDCTTTYIFGGAFVDSLNLNCRVIEVYMDENGFRTNGAIHYLSPKVETYIELIMHLDSLRQKRSTINPVYSFVSGYSISVTNDGQTYSDSADMFVYDSQCQLAEDKNGTILINLTEGYCFIENRCVINGDTNPDNTCLYCNKTVAPTTWSNDVSKTGCEELNSSDEDNDDKNGEDTKIAAIAGSATGGLLLAAIVTLVTVIILKKLNRKKINIGNSTVFHNPTLMRSASDLDNANPQFRRDLHMT